MEYNFKKVYTGRDLAISFILIAAGAGLFFLNKGLGVTIGACGLLCLLLFKTGYKINEQARQQLRQFGLLYDFDADAVEPQSKLSELNDEMVETLLKYQP